MKTVKNSRKREYVRASIRVIGSLDIIRTSDPTTPDPGIELPLDPLKPAKP